jgi:hypothetical protein
VGIDPHAGQAMRFPGLQTGDRSLKRVRSVTKHRLVVVVVEPIRSRSGKRAPDIAVGRFGTLEVLHHPLESGGIRRSYEPHAPLLPGRATSLIRGRQSA